MGRQSLGHLAQREVLDERRERAQTRRQSREETHGHFGLSATRSRNAWRGM